MADDKGNEWRVDIFDTQYSGSPDAITLSGEGFNVQWDGDIRNKVNPIVTSSATIEFVMQDATDENIMTLIAGNVEGRFSVGIYQVIATIPVLWWTGTVLTDQVSYLDEYYPIRAEITASDDIGALQDVPYDNDGAPYASNQYKTVIGHVHEALLKCRQLANFYDATDSFLVYANDFYSVDDDVSVTDHLNSARILNLTWNNPDDEGDNQIVSAYEVIESICKTYNARLMQFAGYFRFMPIGAYQNNQTQVACERLLFNGTQGTGFTDTAIEKEVGTGFNKLRGWRFEFHQPYKRTTRTQAYNGNLAILLSNFYNLKTSNTLSDTDRDYPSGTLLKLGGTAQLTYDGDGTTTGDGRVGRFLVRISLQVGTRYLKREVTFSGTSYDFQMEPGTVLEYTTGAMGGTSWSATSDTFDTLTPVFDRNAGASAYSAIVYTLDQVLPALPADLTGLDFSASLYDVDEDGTLTLVTTSATYTGAFTPFRLDWVDADASNGDTLAFTAVGQDDNRNTLDQGEVIIGDRVSSNSRGVIFVETSIGYNDSSGWRSLNVTTGTLSIHRLGVEEVHGLHNTTTKGVQGQLYHEAISMHQLLKDDGDYYMPTSMSFSANSRITDFQGFKLTRDTTDISSDQADRNDVNPPVIGTGTQVGLNAADFTTEPGGGAVDSVNGISPVSGDVTIDSDDIDYTGTGGGSITSAIGANTSNIEAVKAYVVSATDKVTLTEDSDNKIEVDGTSSSEKVTVTVAGVDALEIDDASALFSGLVKSGGIELASAGDSLIMTDSASDRWRIQIQTDGTLRTTKL